MDLDDSLQLLNKDIHLNQLPSIIKLKPQIRGALNIRHEKDKSINQMKKKGCPKALEKLCFYNEDPLLQSDHKANLLMNALKALKGRDGIMRLKSLKHLDINLTWFLLIPETSLVGFSEFLKRIQDFSVIHFYNNTILLFITQNQRAFSQAIRRIHPSSHLNIKLSLTFYLVNKPEDIKELLGCFYAHECLTAACFSFNANELSDIKEIMAPFKNSKSLARLDLSIFQGAFSDPERAALQDLLLILAEMKSIKDLKITIRTIVLENSDLKAVLPGLKRLAQTMNVKIIFSVDDTEEYCKFSTVFDSEWKEFVKSIKSFPSSHQVAVEYTGKVQARDSKFLRIYNRWDTIIICLLLIYYFFQWLGHVENLEKMYMNIKR